MADGIHFGRPIAPTQLEKVAFTQLQKTHHELWVTEKGREESFWVLGGDWRHVDERHVDIDKDGDVDIAARMTDGAIYVWHQI